MTWTKVDYDVAMEIAGPEAIIRQAYKDSVGVWTWSVGLTAATGHNVLRYKDKPVGLKRCLEVYVWALDQYAEAVRDVFRGTKLSKNQFTAALSFHWNTGAIRRASWVGKFKRGDMRGAEAAFKAWNKAGGKVSKGLVNRRNHEWKLFSKGIWSNDGRMTEYTRLTSRYTPVWSSAKKIDVRKELETCFRTPTPTPVDHEPEPDAEVLEPTLTPDPEPAVPSLPDPPDIEPIPEPQPEPAKPAGSSDSGVKRMLYKILGGVLFLALFAGFAQLVGVKAFDVNLYEMVRGLF